jgi:hypothetical protein
MTPRQKEQQRREEDAWKAEIEAESKLPVLKLVDVQQRVHKLMADIYAADRSGNSIAREEARRIKNNEISTWHGRRIEGKCKIESVVTGPEVGGIQIGVWIPKVDDRNGINIEMTHLLNVKDSPLIAKLKRGDVVQFKGLIHAKEDRNKEVWYRITDAEITR